MKIKHWQGYGSVTATKVSKTIVTNPLGEEYQVLRIKVSGNHEWGLEHNDVFDCFSWLVKKFDKSVTNWQQIIRMTTTDTYVNGVEECLYTFVIKSNK